MTKIKHGKYEFRLDYVFPMGVHVTSRSTTRRPIVCAYISRIAPNGSTRRFVQLFYKSSGKNSGLPDEWLPFMGIEGIFVKACVDPETLHYISVSSKMNHGRYGNKLYEEMSKVIKDCVSDTWLFREFFYPLRKGEDTLDEINFLGSNYMLDEDDAVQQCKWKQVDQDALNWKAYMDFERRFWSHEQFQYKPPA